MSKRDKYAPDYQKLYPGVEFTPAVLHVLDQSDRKMQYFELDLKAERKRKNKRTKAVIVSPAREDSLERLVEDNEKQYALEESSPEESLVERDEQERLHRALQRLKPKEYALIHAIYYERLSERAYAKQIDRAARRDPRRGESPGARRPPRFSCTPYAWGSSDEYKRTDFRNDSRGPPHRRAVPVE